MTTANTNKFHMIRFPNAADSLLGDLFGHESERVVQELAMKHSTRYVSVELPSARDFACPDCGAAVGAPCAKKDGNPSRTHHSHRVSEARAVAWAAAKAKLVGVEGK